MPCASQPRVGSRRAKKRRPKNAITRTSSRERVEQRNRKLASLPLRARRKSTRPNSPSMCKRESAKQEQEAKRLLRQTQREERKREQEEHRQRKQQEREERKREQALKRERRLRAQEEREQERLRRLQWHQEIKRERERRLARKQERMACLAAATAAPSSTLSTIFADQQALVPLPKPT